MRPKKRPAHEINLKVTEYSSDACNLYVFLRKFQLHAEKDEDGPIPNITIHFCQPVGLE